MAIVVTTCMLLSDHCVMLIRASTCRACARTRAFYGVVPCVCVELLQFRPAWRLDDGLANLKWWPNRTCGGEALMHVFVAV